MTTKIVTKQPSDVLASLIKDAAESFLNFASLWQQVKTRGEEEGFSENELQNIIIPLLKNRLTRHQIRYLFHREAMKKNTKDQYNKMRNITQNDSNKVIEQSFTGEIPIEKSVSEERLAIQDYPVDQYGPPVEAAPKLFQELKNLKEVVARLTKFEPASKVQAQEDVMKPDDGINIIKYKDIAIQEFLYNVSKLKSSVKRFGIAYLEVSK